MTTPERLRRRQRIEGIALIILGVFTVAISLYFRIQDNSQRACVSSFIATTSQTATIRGRLLERESQATRAVIRAALTAHNRGELIRARRHYFVSLQRIDQLRDDNPIVQFDESVCK